jgi:sulfatase-modifying factor enzyme 1/conflict system STAND superfamily ATPase
MRPSYTLDDMWASMMQRDDGTLRLPAQSFELGGVLADRANRFLEMHPGAEDALWRVLTLRLATVRDDGEPTRRRAARAEFTAEEWRLVSELADYPNRLLVTVTTETGETYAEVAHEAIFRRWGKLRKWIAVEREFLAWHSGLEAARRAWQAAPERSKRDALLMGFALTQAQSWIAKRADDIPQADQHFIQQSRRVARSRRWRARLLVTLVGALSVPAVILGIVLYAIGLKYWREAIVSPQYARIETLPYVLTTAQEQALKPGDSFRECARDCPEMIVVPSGLFVMGAPEARYASQIPQHTVTIPQSFAVSKYELTSADWDACFRGGGCNDWTPSDSGWGRGERPVIYVSWEDAQHYVAWFSQVTGKSYRLLSEAEYEYAARAGMMTEYPLGGRYSSQRNGDGQLRRLRQQVGQYANSTGRFIPAE